MRFPLGTSCTTNIFPLQKVNMLLSPLKIHGVLNHATNIETEMPICMVPYQHQITLKLTILHSEQSGLNVELPIYEGFSSYARACNGDWLLQNVFSWFRECKRILGWAVI